jgi:hypothetical protein
MTQIDDSPVDTIDDAPGTTRHTYPASAMAGDYLRAAAGLVPSGVLLVTVPVSSAAAVVLGSFAAIFAVFGVRTLVRHGTRIEMTETELRAVGPRQQAILWTELDRLRLAYYSTRKDRHGGWMQLELGAGRTRVRLDSRIDGFDDLVRRAVIAASAHNLPLNEATVANLEALGIKVPTDAKSNVRISDGGERP